MYFQEKKLCANNLKIDYFKVRLQNNIYILNFASKKVTFEKLFKYVYYEEFKTIENSNC